MQLYGVRIKAQNDVLSLRVIYVEKRLIHSLSEEPFTIFQQ